MVRFPQLPAAPRGGVIAVVSGSALAGLGGPAVAAPAAGIPPLQCAAMSATAVWSPGLRARPRPQSVVVTGRLSGCSDPQGPLADSGPFTAVMTGMASTGALQLTGTASVTWPADSGFGRSTASVRVSGAAGQDTTLAGELTSGPYPYPAGELAAQWRVAASGPGESRRGPVTTQRLVGTGPFEAILILP